MKTSVPTLARGSNTDVRKLVMKTLVSTLASTSEFGTNIDVRKLVMKTLVSTLAITLGCLQQYTKADYALFALYPLVKFPITFLLHCIAYVTNRASKYVRHICHGGEQLQPPIDKKSLKCHPLLRSFSTLCSQCWSH